MSADQTPTAKQMEKTERVIKTVSPGSKLLKSVKELGKKNSRWLGHFPAGAFDEAAHKNRIIAVTEGADILCGYLLFRTSNSYVTIVHLCVDSDFRGTGVPEKLFDALKAKTNDCIGVKLSCRRDFAAAALWPRLGFIAVNERAGRSASGSTLTIWFYSYGQPTLFEASEYSDPRVRAALDANILYDIQDLRSHRGIAALSAGWLTAEIDFCLTSEIYNEIDRSKSKEKRRRRRSFVERFTVLKGDELEEKRLFAELCPLFPKALSRSDRSDLLHLCKAISAGAQFFVTWDTAQLKRSAKVHLKFGLKIVRPIDLVVGLDARLREAEYVPARLAGCLTTINRMGPSETIQLQAKFQDFGRAETRGAFIDLLHQTSTDLHNTEIFVVSDRNGEDVALFAFDWREPTRLRVPLLRIRRNQMTSGLAEYIVWRAVRHASHKGCATIEVEDPFLAPAAEPALRTCDYRPKGRIWRKHVFRLCGTPSEVLSAISERSKFAPDETIEEAGGAIREIAGSSNPKFAARFEQLFWPLRITGAGLPTFVVPIRPAFATHLFDEDLATQDLFGAKEHLAFSLRNVYFRSARGIRVPAPARILWYVSGQKDYVNVRSIRAVSLVEETVRGPAKELFRRFERLGAYEWPQILEHAGSDENRTLEAFTFTHTELLPHPIDFHTAQKLLVKNGARANPFAGPVQIPDSSFAEIYRLATTGDRP